MAHGAAGPAGLRGGAGRGASGALGEPAVLPGPPGPRPAGERPARAVRAPVCGRARAGCALSAGRVRGAWAWAWAWASALPAPRSPLSWLEPENHDPGGWCFAPRAGRAERGGWGTGEGEPEGPPAGLPLQWHVRTTSKWLQDDSSPVRTREVMSVRPIASEPLCPQCKREGTVRERTRPLLGSLENENPYPQAQPAGQLKQDPG